MQDHTPQVPDYPANPAPPTAVVVYRQEQCLPPSRWALPDSNLHSFPDVNAGWQDAPDPIRNSDFYADGNKIHPQARMRFVSHLNFSTLYEMISSFEIAKTRAIWQHPMYAGTQTPGMDTRINIETPPYRTTFGAEQQIPMTALSTSTMEDGYPY